MFEQKTGPSEVSGAAEVSCTEIGPAHALGAAEVPLYRNVSDKGFRRGENIGGVSMCSRSRSEKCRRGHHQ